MLVNFRYIVSSRNDILYFRIFDNPVYYNPGRTIVSVFKSKDLYLHTHLNELIL